MDREKVPGGMTFFLAFRNLVLLRKRYAVIGIAVALGFALMTVITGVTSGALNTVQVKAARYFAGHISVTGFSPDRTQKISSPDHLVELLRTGSKSIRTVSKRTVYYRQNASLFFGGETVRQRRLVGVEFDTEADELGSMKFKDGSIEAMLGNSAALGILISKTAADLLGARVGDDVQLYLTTDTGQFNTATLVVRGIFDESSIFGFAAYMRNQDLNVLLGRPTGAATDIAVYTRNGANLARTGLEVRSILAAEVPVLPVLNNKRDRWDALEEEFDVEMLAVMSLNAHLAQITDILDALSAVSFFVLLVFVIIVMVGILNTYRVIVYERTKEIGTMRALGMKRKAVSALFIIEAAMLAGAASTVGLVLGAGMLRLLGCIDFSVVAAAGMFTEAGRLASFIDPSLAVLNISAMIMAVMLAAFGPARKAGSIRPVDAMRMNG
jgi:ABC-type lipoprotein release transport system permease subunit